MVSSLNMQLTFVAEWQASKLLGSTCLQLTSANTAFIWAFVISMQFLMLEQQVLWPLSHPVVHNYPFSIQKHTCKYYILYRPHSVINDILNIYINRPYFMSTSVNIVNLSIFFIKSTLIPITIHFYTGYENCWLEKICCRIENTSFSQLGYIV